MNGKGNWHMHEDSSLCN